MITAFGCMSTFLTQVVSKFKLVFKLVDIPYLIISCDAYVKQRITHAVPPLKLIYYRIYIKGASSIESNVGVNNTIASLPQADLAPKELKNLHTADINCL
ncbi:MAG: hypothetical protein N3D82_04205 [Ignisphaera sp.]|nr:hypothetical protein [Ignisphaera sp.]